MNNVQLPRIAIVGSRGIPASYGGFETFAEEISVHLYRLYGYHVTVVCDDEQRKKNDGLKEYKGVSLVYSDYAKSRNPIRFYYDSIKKTLDSDIIYSCGPAGGLFGMVARRNGKIMMTNPDGLNSKRSKWNWFVQQGFRLFERVASKFSNYVVCDSYGIEAYIQKEYGVKNTFVAEYGAYVNPFIDVKNKTVDEVLDKYNLRSGNYHLVVSRLEPENNIEIIERAYLVSQSKYPLIIVGGLKETDFVKKLREIASDNVHFLDGIYNKDELAIIRANAVTYLHGHSVGGTNPSLLEAMASKNLCIAHDNVFNREVLQDKAIYFSDIEELSSIYQQVELDGSEAFASLREGALQRVIDYYNWNNITSKYHDIFSTVLSESHA